MKVVYLSPSAALGGAERCLLDLLTSVRKADPRCAVALVSAGDGPLVERARALGVDTFVLEMPPELQRAGDSALRFSSTAAARVRLAAGAASAALAAARHAIRLRGLLRRLRPDVVHSNGMKYHLLAPLAFGASAPVLWHVRDFVQSRRLMSVALKAVAPRARGVIAISRAVAADVSRCLPRLPVELVYDAIDVDEFSPGVGDAAALDRMGGLPEGPAETLRVGLVATYARWKGQDLFLRAAAQVARAAPRARFFVAGGPIYATRGSQFTREELQALARDVGMEGRVGFVPFQSEPAWLYRSLDVVVHASSRPEPFGRTIAEAMSCGRPIVASRDAGAAELLGTGGEGVLFAPGDAGALAVAIARFIADPALRARTGDAARAVAVAQFSAARIGQQMKEIYGRLVDGRAARWTLQPER